MLYAASHRLIRIGTLALILTLVVSATGWGQKLYKYRDENGNWVFTDRQPDDTSKVETLTIEQSFVSPELVVERRDSMSGSRLVVRNTYRCPVEIVIMLDQTLNVSAPDGDTVRLVVGPDSEELALEIRPADPNQPMRFGYRYRYIPGEPNAKHRPELPYKVPFSSGRSFTVSQAYPNQYTHKDVSSRYAVDIAMPEGTAVFAARTGTVVDIATRFFQNGTDRRQFGARANHVRILHDDGSMAIYAHLQWDSIRVRPGDRVDRGEYIADSGNTGFSTGPHLHFDVQVNAGLSLTSVPFEFENVSGVGYMPGEGEIIKSYR